MPLEWTQIEDDIYPATHGDRLREEKIVDGLRIWHPSDSKLAAILVKNRNEDLDLSLPLEEETKILYLGAAAGTTPSYLADLSKVVYSVEIASKPSQKLLEVAEERQNIIPIVEDARKPGRYDHAVEKVDFMYQDVATRGQAEVANSNAFFLRENGTLCLCVKAKSEDVTADPEDVYGSVSNKLEEEYDVRTVFDLEPFYDDHAAVIAEKK